MTIKEARAIANITQAQAAELLQIPKRTLEDWESGKRKPPEYVEKMVIEKLTGYRYFCNECGTRFMFNLPERDDLGLLNDIVCPRCGGYNVYPDTPAGAAASVRHTMQYENELNALED